MEDKLKRAQSKAIKWGWKSQFCWYGNFSPLIFLISPPGTEPPPTLLQATPSSQTGTQGSTFRHSSCTLHILGLDGKTGVSNLPLTLQEKSQTGSLMSSRRPTNPSPRQDLLDICSTMSCTLLFAALREALVYKRTGLCEAPFISVEWLFHCEATRRVTQLKGHPVSIYVRWQLQNISPSVWTALLFLAKLLFSVMKSICKQYYHFFLIALETIWAPRKRFPSSEGRELIPHPVWTAHVALNLKPIYQSCVLGVKLMRIAREDGGHLYNYPTLNLNHLSAASWPCQNQTCRLPFFSFLTINKVNNFTVANH